MSTVNLSGKRNIDALLVGTRWAEANTQLTYSIPNNIGGTFWDSSYSQEREPDTWSALTNAQVTAFRESLQTWSDVANIALVEVPDTSTSYGDIRIAFSQAVAKQSNVAAWAYVPDDIGISDSAGDVWLNPKTIEYSSGSYGFATLIHELGHAFGLKHPFSSTPLSSTQLNSDIDTTQYTLMSYTDYEGAGYIFKAAEDGRYKYGVVNPTTPMLLDIQAIQYLYGENTQSHLEDNTYQFSNTHGEIKTIWDAGGIDTFDLSNQTLDMKINLNDGVFSSLGVKQLEFKGPLLTATDNIAIAYNTEIENAIGGKGNDIITGNELQNEITGGQGNDTIDGGLGVDTAIYLGNKDQYTLEVIGESITVKDNSNHNEGLDTLYNIENITFSDQTIATNTLTNDITEIPPTKSSEVITQPLEGDKNHINYFLLEISEPLTTAASVHYHTQDNTALAGQDYIAISGIATIRKGETSTVIAVEIIADTIKENNETFSLVVTDPEGAIFPTNMTEITATHTIIDDDINTRSNRSGDLIGISLFDTETMF